MGTINKTTAVINTLLDKVNNDVTTVTYADLSSRPVATAFTGLAYIITATYSIQCISDGTAWFSKGKSALISARPAAAAFGIGQWQIGGTNYVSDGVSWSLATQNESPIILPTGGNLTPFKSALKKTQHGKSNTRAIFWGDSITIGFNEGPQAGEILESYPTQAAEQLKLSLIPAGHQTGYGGSGLALSDIALSSVDTRFAALGGGWQAFDSLSFHGATLWNNSTINPITFTPNLPCNAIDVYYLDVSGYDPFVVKAGATTIGTATITATNLVKKLTCTTGSAAVSGTVFTIQKALADAKNLIVVGFECYDTAIKQLTVVNSGIHGALLTSNLAVANTQFWQAMRMMTDSNSPVKFDLVAINYGVNHWANVGLNPVATFQTALDTLAVSPLVAASIPVLLFTPPPSPSSVCAYATQKTYVDAILSVALTYNVAVIDVWNAWQGNWEYGNALGYYRAGADVHPSQLGYGVIAGYFRKFINAII